MQGETTARLAVLVAAFRGSALAVLQVLVLVALKQVLVVGAAEALMEMAATAVRTGPGLAALGMEPTTALVVAVWAVPVADTAT